MTVTMRFESVLTDASHWVDVVMSELRKGHKRSAYAALRATLHAVRDSLDRERAVRLGEALPTLIRGLYYEGWAAGNGPPHILRPTEFLDAVRHALRGHEELSDSVTSVQATFAALSKLLPQQELDDVVGCLPSEIRQLCQPTKASA
jgi:uncharacterized protein (DUF2267 family)